MKYFLMAMLATVLFISCKKQEEQKVQEEQTTETLTYPAGSIGQLPETLDKDKTGAIKKIWDKELQAAGIAGSIESFEIVGLDVAGEEGATFKTTRQYALKAVTADGKATLTALLLTEGKALYLDYDTPAIICSSDCDTPCEPGAIYKNGKAWLVCNGCADCVKTDFML